MNLSGTIRKGGPRTRGYVLIRRKPYRNWLQHRAVVDVQVREFNACGWDGLPPWLHVHHADHDRSNNFQSGNLLILDDALHRAFHREPPRCPYTGRYLPTKQGEAMSDEYLNKICGGLYPELPCEYPEVPACHPGERKGEIGS